MRKWQCTLCPLRLRSGARWPGGRLTAGNVLRWAARWLGVPRLRRRQGVLRAPWL